MKNNNSIVSDSSKFLPSIGFFTEISADVSFLEYLCEEYVAWRGFQYFWLVSGVLLDDNQGLDFASVHDGVWGMSARFQELEEENQRQKGRSCQMFEEWFGKRIG